MKSNDDLDMVKQKMHLCPGKELLDLMLGVNQKGKNPSMFFVFKHTFEDVMECPYIWQQMFICTLSYLVRNYNSGNTENVTRVLAAWSNPRG